ncbi:aspartate/glutamate racemase family protein [Enterococcus alcedinis]|uniref:Racemase n=1 Tax=Enterococcus alcedinis TaxID=1274384 RepID=A0A917JFM1_9ENTE|nr:aspartate/glutamate racemase family protein [Enterococcus alcedinis]MBP2101321.1 aspartate racemase [Enterococcus alcedinis]GGI64379.1 racemase [Enterococcus alcedinis]
MKIIGLIGGMSWESTVTYYEQINQLVNQQLGGLHSAKILLASVDFNEIEAYQRTGEWEKSGNILADEAIKLEKGGADFILICTNTMHKVFDQIQKKVSIPILHIADATIAALKEHQMKRVGLLGTKYTMQQDFYKERIMNAEIAILIPKGDEIDRVNDIIFEELVRGVVRQESKKEYLKVIDSMIARGAQGIILGCTEIGLLVSQEDVTVPIFDTTLIHSEQAVRESLAEIQRKGS